MNSHPNTVGAPNAGTETHEKVQKIHDRYDFSTPSTAFRTKFTGFWTDRVDAEIVLQRRLEDGSISTEAAQLLWSFIRNGYAILKGAVAEEAIDNAAADFEAAWDGKFPELQAEWWEQRQLKFAPPSPDIREKENVRLPGLYAVSQHSRNAMFSKSIRDFLRLVFNDDILAFQSLSFLRGSQQAIHQDTAFVPVDPPLQFAACWIALEDVREGTGELEYFEGSHRLASYLFQGKYKNIPPNSGEMKRFHDSLRERCEALGMPLRSFLPKKGDALIWASDLCHGGSKVTAMQATRKSLVVHYCPATAKPHYVAQGRGEINSYGDGCFYSICSDSAPG